MSQCPRAKLEIYEPMPDICGPCGGECCKRMPGPYHPDQLTDEQVIEGLASGNMSLDCIDGIDHGDLWYVRPATRNSLGAIDKSWGGECVHLSAVCCPSTSGLSDARRSSRARTLAAAGIQRRWQETTGGILPTLGG